MLPIRSGFPDFGPDPDFLAKTGPEMVWFLPKSPDLQKNMCFNAYIYYIFSAFILVRKNIFQSDFLLFFLQVRFSIEKYGFYFEM